MSVTFPLDVEIAASPEKVFACLTDMECWSSWMHGLVRIEKLTDGAYGKGTMWREVRKMYGREAGEVFEVTELDAPNTIGLYVDGSKGVSRKGEYRFRHTLTPVAGGTATRLHMDSEIDMPGLMFKLLGKLFLGGFKKAMDKDNQSLKRYIETVAAAQT